MLVVILLSGMQLSRLRCELPSVGLLLSDPLIQRSSSAHQRHKNVFIIQHSKRNWGEKKLAFVKIRKISYLEDMHGCRSC